MTKPVPELLLERYRLGELAPDAARRLEGQLADDPALRARLDALDASDADIARRYDAAAWVKRRAHRRSPRALLLAAAAIGAALLVVAVLPQAGRPVAAPEDRVKGTAAGHPSLMVYRRTAAGSERLAEGDVLHAGDLVRLGYAAAGRRYGVILSIDGRGTVTLHLPPSGDRASALGAGATVLLDAAYELDDAPRVERFYFVTGAEPFAVSPIVAAARRAAAAPASLPAALTLSPALEQASFAIQKEERK